MQIHQHPRQLPRMSRVVLLPLPNIDEPLRELVPVRRVVAAAPPDPISVELPRALASAAPAGGQLPLPAGPTHCVDDSRRQDGVCERRLLTRCNTKSK